MKPSKQSHITAFYVETLVLVSVLVAVLLVLTQTFAAAHSASTTARELTDAVCLAKNAAEAVSAADSPESLLSLLNEDGNAAWEGSLLRAAYDSTLTPDADGCYTVTVSWEPEPHAAGTLVHSNVTVSYETEQVYTLTTSVYLREEDAS